MDVLGLIAPPWQGAPSLLIPHQPFERPRTPFSASRGRGPPLCVSSPPIPAGGRPLGQILGSRAQAPTPWHFSRSLTSACPFPPQGSTALLLSLSLCLPLLKSCLELLCLRCGPADGRNDQGGCPSPTRALVAVTRQAGDVPPSPFPLLSFPSFIQPGITLYSASEKGLRMGGGCYPCQT